MLFFKVLTLDIWTHIVIKLLLLKYFGNTFRGNFSQKANNSCWFYSCALFETLKEITQFDYAVLHTWLRITYNL